MYKTIRHGENSLQYTILPQNDDFRIEGKLSSAGSSSSSSGNGNGNASTAASSRKSKAKRPKRRSFFAYLGLIFVCTVIIGAILIPFLVSAECLPSPTEWFLKTKAALIKSGGGGGESNAGGGGSNTSSGGNRNSNGNGINVGKTVKIISKDGVEKIILKLNKTVAEQPPETPGNVNKTAENTSNTSNLNKTAEMADKFAAGSAAAIAAMQAQQMETERGGDDNNSDSNSEKEADMQRHEDVVTDLNDSNLNAKPNANNDKPIITQTETFVAEARFEDDSAAEGAGRSRAALAAAAAPLDQMSMSVIAPTITVTTLTGQQQHQQQQQQPQLNSNRIIDINYNNKNEPPLKPYATAPYLRPTSSFSTASVNAPRAPPNPNQNSILNSNPTNSAASPAMPTIMTRTRIIQVPLLKAAAKKPIIPPVLAKTNSQSRSSLSAYKTNNIMVDSSGSSDSSASAAAAHSIGSSVAVVEHSQQGVDHPAALPNDEQPPKNSDWVHSHWPYIDPTTYFQWTGYKAEDSFLLPALLGFAIIGVILVITVCLVARNKRTIVSSVRKRNRNDIEETGAEDNATLLTTTNLSDED